MFEADLSSDIYSWMTMGVVALVAIWLVMFVVRKLIAIALVFLGFVLFLPLVAVFVEALRNGLP